MRITISLMLLCCIPTVLLAREEYKRDFQKTAALPAGRTLRVDHSLGSVNVRTQAKNEVAVQAALRCSAQTAESARHFCDQIPIRGEEGGPGGTAPTQDPPNATCPPNMSYSANPANQHPAT